MMRPTTGRQFKLRTARFERFEDRLLLAGHGSGDVFFGDPVEQPVELQATNSHPTLVQIHETTGVADVYAEYGLSGAGQTVAIIDTGIAYDHYALGGGLGTDYRVVGGWDFTDEADADPYDDAPAGFHGTHVAGIIASDDPIHRGVAPDVDLVALRVFDDQGRGEFEWIENALEWVHENKDRFRYPITTVNLSIGSDVNSNSVPDWAMLEDELARLEADDMFISVSAGNWYPSYGLPGLSYPASSPHVVPAASVSFSGALSRFSQRNDRIIAAPGQSITSTAPDYLYDFDGITNDFVTASGTSMAAPYVAGASVLLREAMQVAGYTDVDQELLYGRLRDTADIVLDHNGAQYRRLNVRRAVESIMPEDDYGSTPDTAYSLGTLSGTVRLSGIIGRLDDRDVFTFVAGGTGRVTFRTNGLQRFAPRSRLLGGPEPADEAPLIFDVQRGQSYTVELMTGDAIGRYEATVEMLPAPTNVAPSTRDLGVVDFIQLGPNDISSTGSWFRFQTVRSGLITVDAIISTARENSTVSLYDSDRQLLLQSQTRGRRQRLDFEAFAGQTFYLWTASSHPAANLRLANLVSIDGGTWNVSGTNGADRFEFVAGTTSHSLSVNGIDYVVPVDELSHASFDAGLGEDLIRFTGSSDDEQADIRVGSGTVTGPRYQVTFNGVEKIRVVGGGGSDEAELYDSPRDDRFYGRPAYSVLRDVDYRYHNYVEDFDRVYARATNGGSEDRAYLHESAGNDRFYGSPGDAVFRGENFEFFNHVEGFDRVYAFAGGGKDDDKAYLYDSAGDDSFYGRPRYSVFRGENDEFYNYASGFHEVYAYASAGGPNDRAFLYDSTGNDVFLGYPTHSVLRGNNFEFYNHVEGFDRVFAYAAAGGNGDQAELYDSSGNDRFISRPNYSILRGDQYEFYSYVRGFEHVDVYAIGGGTDLSVFYDLRPVDTLFGRGNVAVRELGNSLLRAVDFDLVRTYTNSDEVTPYDIHSVDYVFQQVAANG